MYGQDKKVIEAQATELASKMLPLVDKFVNNNNILNHLEACEVASSILLTIYTDIMHFIYVNYISPDQKEICIHDLIEHYYALLQNAFDEKYNETKTQNSNILPFRKKTD